MRLVVEDSFAAAHRLMKHPGKCRNLHGHTWKVRVELEGVPDKQTGMVVDFGCIKEIIQQLDHKTLLNVSDPLFEVLDSVIGFQSDPTCECIAKWIADRVINVAGKQISYIKVTIWESEKQSATYSIPVDGP